MKRILAMLRDFELRASGRSFLMSVAVGVVVGIGAIVFEFLSRAVQHGTLGMLAGYDPPGAMAEHSPFELVTVGAPNPWMILVVMAVGGLLTGILVSLFAPEAEGPGTDAAIDAFHNRDGRIAASIPIIKTLASAITLGTGGSAGREGPIVQIGAGLGSWLATTFRLSDRDRRILLAAGMGAGVGAVFRAPLAGALFAGEILYRDADLEADVVVPAAVSSTVAYSVFCMSLPPSIRFQPLFGRDVQFDVASPIELLPYTALAVVLVVVGLLYIQTFTTVRTLFRQLPVTPIARPMIGAVLAGATGLAVYFWFGRDPDALSVLGSGYGILQKTFGESSLSFQLLLAVALVKIATTSMTVSSGGSGGVFGPSMVIGGCLGAAVGKIFHGWWPELVRQPQAFAIVGMAGFFSGTARAPFSTILMVTELTGNYTLLLPAMWVSALCFLLTGHWTLYEKQVRSRLDSPAHRFDFIVDVLEGIRVGDVYQQGRKLTSVHEGASLDEVVHLLAKTKQRYFPVVDSDNQMIGIFSTDDVRRYLFDDTLWNLAIARDIMTSPVITVTPDDDLNTALAHFTELNVDELPVVDPENSSELKGVLRRKETIAAYNQRRLEYVDQR